MALGTREVLVVVRARDVATRTLQNVGGAFGLLGANASAASNNLFKVGSALTSVGVISAAAGVQVLGFLDDSVDAFMEYEKQASLAQTQTQGLGITLDDLLDMGRRVARDLPVPFEQIQPTLFDIFSTLDTLNLSLEETEVIVRAFSKAAVAGNVEMREASRATMAIMNGFGLEAKDVNDVLDLQFQMVHVGTGTYGEFASAIGLAIPAFSNANQEVGSLTGAIAFLTKQGLSASRSATSAARAMELIAKPDSVANLEDLGVAVRDADGNFNDLQTIMNDLATSAGWAEMTGPERAAAFKETFGTGTIQARRFFDSVIPNIDTYNSVMDSMENSTGAMEDAFAIMGDTGAAKAQLLSNNYEALKTEIGERLLPVKIRLMEAAMELFDWWDNLSEGTKDLIVKIAAAVGVFLTIFGVVVTLIGAFAIFAALVGGVVIAIKILLIVAAVSAVLAAAAFLITDNWETVGPVLEDTWNTIVDATMAAWEFLKQVWDWLQNEAWPVAQDVFENIKTAVMDAWEVVSDAAVSAWDTIVEFWQWLSQTFGPGLVDIWNTIQEETKKVVDAIIKFWKKPGPIVGAIADAFVAVFDIIVRVVRAAAKIIIGIVLGAVDLILAFWDRFGSTIINVIKIAWKLVVQVIQSAIELIGSIIRFFLALLSGEWGDAWNAIKDALAAIWDLIFEILRNGVALIIEIFINLLPNILGFLKDAGGILVDVGSDILGGLVEGLFGALQRVWDFFFELGRGIIRAVKSFFGIESPATKMIPLGIDIILGFLKGLTNALPFILNFFISLPGRVLTALGDVTGTLIQKGRDILNGLKNGFTNIWNNTVRPWWNSLPSSIRSAIGSVASTLTEKGKSVLRGLWNGIKFFWRNSVKPWLDIAQKIKDAVGDLSSTLYNIGKDLINGLWEGMKDAWESVSGWLSDRAGSIADLKGPKEKDRVLLTENGMLIMQGLLKGLESGWVDVVRFLSMASGELGMFGTDLGDTMMEGVMPGFRGNGDLPELTGNASRIGLNIEHATFGDERVVEDLDWWTRTEGAGV